MLTRLFRTIGGPWLRLGGRVASSLSIAVLFIACLSMVALAGCSKQKPPCYLVSGQQARAMLEPGTILLDVRTRQQEQVGRVKESIHIPVDELSYRLKYLSLNTRIIVFGQTERQAREAATILRRSGYEVFELGPVADLQSSDPKCEM